MYGEIYKSGKCMYRNAAFGSWCQEAMAQLVEYPVLSQEESGELNWVTAYIYAYYADSYSSQIVIANKGMDRTV